MWINVLLCVSSVSFYLRLKCFLNRQTEILVSKLCSLQCSILIGLLVVLVTSNKCRGPLRSVVSYVRRVG